METVDLNEIAGKADEATFVMPRKANAVIAEALTQKPSPPLFDGFWRTGEVAMLFGEAGAGKSLLAVQVAEALARGRPLTGLDMPRRRHRVLYVDLLLSEGQFLRRYTHRGMETQYKFAERFYRERPPEGEKLCDWVRKAVKLGGFEVVVIDDLSAVMRTDNGTFDTLKVMQEMKRLSHETRVSVLVLADSVPPPQKQDISEADLRRSRVLCGLADSVFALGMWGRENRRLVHIRSRGDRVVWGSQNPIGCTRSLDPYSLSGFRFDSRFEPKLDPVRSALVCRVNKMQADGMTFREIAKELNVSRSTASRLFWEWTAEAHKLVYGVETSESLDRLGPAEEPEADDESDDDDLDDDHDDDLDDDLDDDRRYGCPADPAAGEAVPSSEGIDPRSIPVAEGSGRRSILDLERDLDGYGHEIFVETRDALTGRPNIWYIRDNKGKYRRSKQSGFTINITTLGTSHYIEEMQE